jgi:HAD superfamily 5'-nucleotidase-like hydrolase
MVLEFPCCCLVLCRLDSIDVVGFDLDFTLAGYNHRMSELVYDLGRDFLINMLSYPSAFRSVKYDPSFGIRGITLDFNHGTLLKLDYNDRVTPYCAYRGRTRLSSADVAKLYGGMHVSRLYREQNMKAMVDMFAMSEACLIANLIQHFMDQQTEFSSRAVAEVSSHFL